MLKALVIDDNRLNADTLCRMLSLLNFDSRPAYGSRAALLAMEDCTPDVVFVDINMPGVSGFDVMMYMQREPRLRQVPLIVVTSDDQADTARKARKTGALYLIVKPASMESIEKALRLAKIVP